MNQTPAVITPLDEHMGLDIARSLAKKNIPVYGVDHDPAVPGRYSKYCQFVQSPNPEGEGEAAYVQFLVNFARSLKCKPVLYPLSDMHVLICSRNRATLQKYYEYVMPDEQTMERLTTKSGLQEIASAFHIPAPKTVFIENPENIEAIAAQLNYPVILKPTESTYWHAPQVAQELRSGLLNGRAKVILCSTPTELIEIYKRISALDHRLVVQEVIPGEDSRLVYISFYFDRNSKPLAMFAGRKHRIIPVGFGSASYVRSFYDPALVEIALRLLVSAKYQGLVGVELKDDPRDGGYKLIEVNTRFGLWDGLSVKCGVDLPYIAYCDTLGLPISSQLVYREGIIWVDWQRDLRAAIEYWRKGQLSFGGWLRSLRGEKMWAIYSADDWRPGAAFTFGLLHKMLDRLTRH